MCTFACPSVADFFTTCMLQERKVAQRSNGVWMKNAIWKYGSVIKLIAVQAKEHNVTNIKMLVTKT